MSGISGLHIVAYTWNFRGSCSLPNQTHVYRFLKFQAQIHMHHFLPIMFMLNRNAQMICIHYMYRYLYATSGLDSRRVHVIFL